MNSVVLSIGGSVIFSNDLDDLYFKKLGNLLNDISKENKIYVVVGGGKIARSYIKFARELGFNEKFLDLIGIDVTRINAKLLLINLGLSIDNIPFTVDEAVNLDQPIVIMGGTFPGHSTDLVGAEIAEKTESKLYIIATNVDGIFDKDPNVFNDAKKIDEIEIDNLINDFGTDWSEAGKNIVIDGPALKIIKRGKINTYVLNGKKINQLKNALFSKAFEGTKILI
jgi:uridylate kinase